MNESANEVSNEPRVEGRATRKIKARQEDAGIEPLHGVVYRLMYGSYGLLFRLGGLKVHGLENVPMEGPVIITPNHASLFDPPLVGCTVPRMVTTMGKAELFEKKTFGLKILGWIIRRMGSFPVKRGAPDRRAIRFAMRVLQSGEALVIFPEGTRTRNGELGPPEPGVALIAHSTKAPVVPMYLKGTGAALSPLQPKFRLIHPEVYFGKPLRFEEEYARKGDRATLEAIGERIMQEIATLKQSAECEMRNAE
jgi:1-acyl-sn-glycerol-3-phosphate acyltransferase